MRLGSFPFFTLVFSFNPRTHVGCDYSVTDYSAVELCFNPRTHVGCDSYSLLDILSLFSFNPRTHVGCDSAIITGIAGLQKFQSTHPCRMRLHHPMMHYRKTKFQSTHPCRMRLRRCILNRRCNRFNPRTHVGCDQGPRVPQVPLQVSIHAPM